MRGLRLWIRPTTPEDREAVDAFYRQESAGEPVRETVSLVGKVLGRIVAHATASREGDSLRVSSLYVARELRRKRIGSAMALELEKIAAASGATSLVVRSGAAVEFFVSLGFIERGGMLRKVIRQARE